MKKAFYILTMALSISLMGCNGADNGKDGSAASSTNNSAASVSAIDNTSQAESQETSATIQAENNAIAPVPTPNLQQKPAMTPEEAEKYKETIALLRDYGKEMITCLDAKRAGKTIDEATKQRITEIKNKLSELDKAGKMNKDHKELLKANNDMYDKLTK